MSPRKRRTLINRSKRRRDLDVLSSRAPHVSGMLQRARGVVMVFRFRTARPRESLTSETGVYDGSRFETQNTRCYAHRARRNIRRGPVVDGGDFQSATS